MNLIENPLYYADIESISGLMLPWEKLENRTLLLSGGSGMIGSCLVDVILHRNQKYGMNCRVYALGRNEQKARSRFSYCWESGDFTFITCDINQPFVVNGIGQADYVLHLASNTHPAAYAGDPIGTIMTNIIGTQHMLEFAREHQAQRFAFASSVEIYGENRGDTELFEESYLGYIDCNTLRAGYPESKRCGEALCQAYRKQAGLDAVIPRFSRVYGSTMLMDDTKAVSQFIKKGAAGECIVLKSAGEQFYSYTYVSDAVSGLLTVLLKGKDGEAYNIADPASNIRLKELASLAAEYSGTNVLFDMPEEKEAAGYSKATDARMDGSKAEALGWTAEYSIEKGIKKTLDILKDMKGK